MVRTGNLFPARLRASHQDKRRNTNHRRNGKLQACEPCRKGKLRCDHMMPTCGRCAKRNKPDQCLYHPAPLTKATTPQTPYSDDSSPAMNSFSILYSPVPNKGATDISLRRGLKHAKRIETVQSASYVSTQLQAALLDSTADLPYNPYTPDSQPISQQAYMPSPQYQRADARSFDNEDGFINHSAVLAEHEFSIGIQPLGCDATCRSEISQSHIDKGVAVLTVLKNFPVIQKYVDKWFSFAGGIVVIEPMVDVYTSGIWSTWHKTLESQRPNDLHLMSQKIWENTLKPTDTLMNRNTTAQEFCTNVTGPSLRWEVVGLIMTLVSLLAQSLKDGDPIFCTHDEAPVDRADLAWQMYNASEFCLSFCDSFGVMNDLYLMLLYENSIAYSAMRTKGSFEESKKVASLAAALVCCNLHQEIKVDDQTPFFMAEFRKRLFICAYENDKYSATYSGRPPKLTRQYCLLQIPLDLTDAQIMSESLDLDSMVNALDEHGWNQKGTIQRSTFARLSATNALITEDILEVALGNLPQSEIIRRAAEIEARTVKAWEELPDFLILDSEDSFSSTRSPLELLFLAFIRLTNLDHRFLLQRTLSKKVTTSSSTPNTKLLSICDEIFKLVVSIVDHKDLFRDFQVDFMQVLTRHGISSAAVLAVELLHQEQGPMSASAMAYPIHRSDTIQSLSVFVSCLGTVKSGSNGYQTCNRARKFLKKILDTILEPGSAAVRESVVFEDVNDLALGAPLLQAGSDGDFVRWLETMDWEQDTWINFS